MNRFSFQKGFNRLQKKDIKEAQKKIKEALGISSSPSWYDRLYGRVEPKISEVEKIEGIFKEYGITDIWGE